MKLSAFQEKIVKEFDYICKLTIKNERKDYFKHLQRISSREVSFSELGEKALSHFSTTDLIPGDYHTFVIKGIPIKIKSTALSEALKELTSRKREILLLYYFIGMNDPEIAKLLNLSVSTVNEHRLNALETLKHYMEDDYCEK
ncbi:RNA polymerase sigma factor, sigma-70 family [Marinilactibacillus piezotolerans]|jgi:RNA polymerase sigma factor (sigma-70 family)|uniref:RNA polymerase sigma factor, sigma-70 family n=1 Tax=Marinilactibacillus piezotolerans TaxID=258723 RepID=A0A1I3X560_9LACT|nr:sigma-70 family RNA polymerase sigma factor [Marinilactibacillus piezotolerans]SFK14690.1 RNA polymerase sigma factor, sigma-70 family [Marinilactibacillus piezotolerans]